MFNLEDLDSITKSKLTQAKDLLSYRPANPKIKAFHKSTAKTRLLLGGKRSSKTYSNVIEVCWAAIGIHPYLDYPEPPLQIRYCTVDFNGIFRIALPYFKKFLYPWAWDGHCSKERPIITLENSTEIELKSYESDIESFEGVSRHICSMDEEPPLDIFQSNFMRTLDVGGKLIISCTPLHGLTWLYDQLYDNPEAVPPAVEHWHVRTDENPYISKDEIEAVKANPAMRDNIEAALYGEFIPKSGLVFKSFSDKNMIDPIKIEGDNMIIIGIDPHDRNPWGVVFVTLTRENDYIVYDEILQAGTVPELAKLIKEKLGKRTPQLCVMDTSGNVVQTTSGKSIKEQLMYYGLYTQDADKDVSAGILNLNSLFDTGGSKKPKLLITHNCINLKRELRHCYDQETEVLTNEGWKLFKNLNRKELIATLNPKTWYLEYQKPTHYIENKYSGKMLLHEGKTTDFCVTPDHNFYGAGRYQYDKPEDFVLSPINQLPKSFMIKRNAVWVGDNKEYFDIAGFHIPMQNWLKFLGIYLSEGYSHISQNQVIISQNKDSKYFLEIQNILHQLPFNFKYDGHQFYFYNKILHDYLYQFGKSQDKYILNEFKNLSSLYLNELKRGLMIGDGTLYNNNNYGKNERYKSISIKLLNDIQEIALKTNQYGNVSISGNEFIFCNKNGYSKINQPEIIDYQGNIYCLTVSNHIIYVRRHGKAMWNGQCVWEDWARNKNQKDPKERILKRDDHLLDALRYVCMLPIIYRHPDFKRVPELPTHISKVTGYF